MRRTVTGRARRGGTAGGSHNTVMREADGREQVADTLGGLCEGDEQPAGCEIAAHMHQQRVR